MYTHKNKLVLVCELTSGSIYTRRSVHSTVVCQTVFEFHTVRNLIDYSKNSTINRRCNKCKRKVIKCLIITILCQLRLIEEFSNSAPNHRILKSALNHRIFDECTK